MDGWDGWDGTNTITMLDHKLVATDCILMFHELLACVDHFLYMFTCKWKAHLSMETTFKDTFKIRSCLFVFSTILFSKTRKSKQTNVLLLPTHTHTHNILTPKKLAENSISETILVKSLTLPKIFSVTFVYIWVKLLKINQRYWPAPISQDSIKSNSIRRQCPLVAEKCNTDQAVATLIKTNTQTLVHQLYLCNFCFLYHRLLSFFYNSNKVRNPRRQWTLEDKLNIAARLGDNVKCLNLGAFMWSPVSQRFSNQLCVVCRW